MGVAQRDKITMEKCQKCSGVMLQMKTKKTTMTIDAEKKQSWKCSRCGFYLEKQQVFSTGRFSDDTTDEDAPYYLRRR